MHPWDGDRSEPETWSAGVLLPGEALTVKFFY